MCDCDVNTTNQPDVETTYSVATLGAGASIYASTTVTPTTRTFNLRSLAAGPGVTINTSPTTITFSSSAVTSLVNNGGGAQVGQNITAGTLNLRTLTGTFASRVTQNANTVNVESDNYQFLNVGTGQGGVYSTRGGDGSGVVTIFLKTLNQGLGTVITQDVDNIYFNSSLVQPISFSQRYNYLQNTSGDIANSYTSSLAITANTFSQTEATLTPTGLTTFDFLPNPRQTTPTIVTSTLTTSDSSQSRALMKVYPDLSVAWDTQVDYLLGCDDNELVYQINPVAGTVALMKDYNGNPLPFTAELIAMDIADNVLFYISAPWITAYDFTTGATEKIIEIFSIAGWSGSYVFMYFNQELSTLFIGNNFNQVFYIPVRPFNRAQTNIIPTGTMLQLQYTPPLVSTIHAMVFLENINNTFFVTYDDGTGTRLAQAECVNGNMNYLLTDPVEGGNIKYAMEIGASGALYLSSFDSGRLYKYSTTSTIASGGSSIMGLGIRLNGLTRSPYGIIA